MNVYQKELHELYHHGIMGMHWGIRRYQPYPSDYKGDGKFIGVSSEGSESKDEKRKIKSTDDIVVKKGTRVYRISKNKKGTDDGSIRYVTIDDNDREFYKAIWPEEIRDPAAGNAKNAEVYEQVYELEKELRMPSQKKRVEILNTLSKRDDVRNQMAIERWSKEAHNRGVFSSRNAAREWAGYINSLANDIGAFKKMAN